MRVVIFVMALMGSGTATSCELSITESWIRAAPPGAMMLAGYATIRNTGTEPLIVDGAASPGFNAVELHESLETDGVARMRELKSVPLAAAAEVGFVPGGKHLMLIGPKSPLKAGDLVEISIRAGKNCTVAAQFEVRAAAPDNHDHHDHQH